MEFFYAILKFITQLKFIKKIIELDSNGPNPNYIKSTYNIIFMISILF